MHIRMPIIAQPIASRREASVERVSAVFWVIVLVPVGFCGLSPVS